MVFAGMFRETGNKLEIKVGNLWTNWPIGDARWPKEKRMSP